ncbi:prenyltransferase/squalene oxidase-like repeat protein [Cohnella sp. SGD-V74]|uniref:S-layer homology domain-containing protein n=1 Tax=unclassified Cohnella TaxID=2636738 RepID=UPI000D4022DA|nr:MULTISPECIES: S-layer homology domain-containing protein [unclassified Cohnella]PRX70667.1 prenyltransferase/squalene oxidase-like repeat protein [Cohnella sp. SGD-V74]
MKRFAIHNRGKWMLTLLIALSLVLQSAVSALAAEGGADGTTAESSLGPPVFTKEMGQALEDAERLLYMQEPLSDWAAVGLALNGKEVPDSYLRAKADELLANRGKYDKVSELARSMAGYAAAGGSVNFIAGLDLYPILMNHRGMEAEGAPGLALAHLVGNRSVSGTLARTEWYSDRIYYKLLELQSEDGSWALPGDASAEGSVAATSTALMALAPASDSEPASKALRWLRTQQSADGGFGGASDTALAVIALSALGIDAAAWTLPDGSQPLQALLKRQLEGGGFSESEGASADMTATVQVYMALAVYKRFAGGESALNVIWKQPVVADSVKVSVEGPEGTIAEGRGQSGEALASAVAFLKKAGIPYKLKSDPEGGQMIGAISGVAEGRYGGQDSWKLAVRTKLGSWLFPENFPDGLRLSEGDELLVYYGSDNTAVLDTIGIEWDFEGQTVLGSPIPAGKPVQLYVKKANRRLGYLIAPGVTVRLAGKTAVSDAEGKVSFGALKPGVYRIEVTGYRKTAVPTIARGDFTLRVFSPELSAYADEAQVSSWARDEMGFILAQGYMQGIDVKGKLLAPKQALTRAEYAALLLRLLGEEASPKTGKTFSDVPADAWYSGTLAKAAELGITDRTSGRFEPSRAITREEAAVMAAKAGRLSTYGSAERMAFSDIDGLSAASRHAIQAVFEHQVMTGSDGKFEPGRTLVREQAAAILARLHVVLYADSLIY